MLAMTTRSNSSPLTRCMVASRTPSVSAGSTVSASSATCARSCFSRAPPMASRSRRVRATTQDAAERRVFCLDLLQVGNDERRLVLAVVEVLEQRLRTTGQRRNPLVVVRTAVEIIDGAAGQQAGGPPAGLLGGAVVQAQLPRPAADVDSTAAEHHLVPPVDALVAVADDEEVVGAGRHDGAEQAIRLRTHVLPLVHDHRGVVQGLGVVLQQDGGVAVRIVHLLQASLGELSAVLLEHAPRPGAGGAVQAAAAADPRNAQVLVQARPRRGPARPAPTRRRRSHRESPGRAA